MNTDFDLAIVGSGFAGSLLAMIARRLGYSVVMVERGRHPRFAIGESSTPLADILWTELTRRFDLPRLTALAKWGSWQRAQPQLACGLKRGFTFYHHTRGQAFHDDASRGRQLLVAASSRDETADTHWYRPDFDQFLLHEAQALGVEYRDETELPAIEVGPAAIRMSGVSRGRPLQVRARFVFDASGPRGFLFRALALPEVDFRYQPPTQALYSHFSGVRRLDECGIPAGLGGAPYPPDDAALHHVFAGGWIWVLRFNNGLTSAGVVVANEMAAELRLAEGEPAWRRLLERLPTVREQFAAAAPVLPFVHAPRLPFRCGVLAGERWALLPHAAGFVDPLLSTGFPLTLLGIARLAGALEAGLDTPAFAERLASHVRTSQAELFAAERLIASLYATMHDFRAFTSLSLLYFAAAAYSEIARRLGRPELAGGFLLHDHPGFGPLAWRACETALSQGGAAFPPADLHERLLPVVRTALETVDVTGLSRFERRNWYPVEAADLIAAAGKFGLSGPEMGSFLSN